MQAVKFKEDIYWVGAIDWSVRNFHGYETSRGSTYNAYLILDDKITLIDTVKHGFEEELLSRISSVVNPADIDYIISSHVEPDHSGGLPFMRQHSPKAEIITSSPQGLKGLTARYGELNYKAVKSGETLNLGRRNLSFVTTPMLHWPDSMVTYCPEEKILFSNDAFGQHLATTERFDDENDLPTVMREAKKYYANILMLFGQQAQKAMQALGGLDIELIATGHGVSWRSHISDILAAYERWSKYEVEDKAVVVFDSMWHSTEIMARTIADAFRQKGIPARYFDLKSNHISDVVTEIFTSRYLAVGSPTLNNQMMPTVASLLCYLKGLAPKNQKAFAFGSYGWGGQSVGLIENELNAMGLTPALPGQKIANLPTAEQLAALTDSVQSLVG
ncbi:MAG: FprA family A-type flavoprotein [Selenomonadaceae bacterium]|nr:FprA family A-type flavoprotein [Selenomonadaceae bacterium]